MKSHQFYPMLYKRTKTGDIQVWHAEREEGSYRSITGKINGKMVTSEWTRCDAKHIGKKNELGAAEQANAEVEATYTKKLRQDFHMSVDRIDNVTRFSPMLAAKFGDVVDRIPDEEVLYFQPKLDGFRCIATKDGLFTRDGLKILTAPHIEEALSNAFLRNPSLIFDGELYNHDLHNDFNTISSVLRKKSPGPADLLRSKTLAQYHMYDLPAMGTHPFIDRYNRLCELLTYLVTTSTGEADTPLRIVETVAGKAEDAVDYLNKFLGQGYEGAIARRNAPYENKRSKTLLKVKKFLDEEFQLVGLEDGRGNRAGIAARAILQLPDGREFAAGIIGSHEYCRDLLKNKDQYVGQMATVQFLNYTPGGVPRGGKLKTIRWA